MRDSIKTYIDNAKKSYKEKNLSEAVRYWNYIYDEFENINKDNFLELREAMSQFTDEEVFAITDCYKYSIGYYK